jgi:hypothetical protein
MELTGIAWIKGLQIVNGGQTTALLHFSKEECSEVDLIQRPSGRKDHLSIEFKTPPKEESPGVGHVPDLQNSQNAVRQSDLSANKPFHVEIEKISA